jgi:hypothetical protein
MSIHDSQPGTPRKQRDFVPLNKAGLNRQSLDGEINMNNEIIIKPVKTFWDRWAGPMSIIVYFLGATFFVVLWFNDRERTHILSVLTLLGLAALSLKLFIETVIQYFWLSWGTERIQQSNGCLIIHKELFGRSIARQFDISKIRYLYLTPKNNSYSYSTSRDSTRISFEYDNKKIGFCGCVPDENAELIIQEVSKLINVPVSTFAA